MGSGVVISKVSHTRLWYTVIRYVYITLETSDEM